MIILFHVIIALAGLIYSGYTFLSPSRAKLRISTGLVGLTMASGTYLVLNTRTHMVQACFSGLLYLGVTATAIAAAGRRMATQKQ